MPRYTKGRVRSAGWEDDDWERGWFDDDEPFRPGIEVDEHLDVDTGLVWATGEPILRAPNPMGFGRDDEW